MRNKGFTIVEVVIALAVISIVSLVATTVIISSRKIERQSSDTIYAQNFCDNAVTVFVDAARGQTNLTDLYKSANERFELLSVKLPGLVGDNKIETEIYFDDNWRQVDDGKISCKLTFIRDENFVFEIAVRNERKVLATAKFEVKS